VTDIGQRGGGGGPGAVAGRGWSGGPAGDRAVCVLAPNPGPMTLDGTNTWVLREPGGDRALVIDPGPQDDAHLERVLDVVRDAGARVSEVLLTHGHLDHSEGAARFAELAGAGVPVRALDPAYRLGPEGLGEGDVVRAGELELRVVGTPGHTSDSLSFLLPADRALLTGDTVLGRGSTVVAHPDGRLAAYLDSLGRLHELAGSGAVTRILPGHGPVLEDALATIEAYQAHRVERLEQVRAALAAGARTPRAVVELVYADVDHALWPAAELSVRAQLDYL
jgi:glyoxylase-like metal-dependent hydrolase (beta-lactamase superfamily II)